MYPDNIFGLIILYSVSNQLGMIPTALEGCSAADIDKLDPDGITVNRYESLLGAQVIGHVSEFDEFPSARRLVLQL